MNTLANLKPSLLGKPCAHAHGLPLGPMAIVIGGIGILMRIRFYWSYGATSLTRDEAALVLNFVDSGFLGLLEPLRLDQAAPIGFLLTEQTILTIFGTSELSFRLLSLLAAILIIPLAYMLMRDILSPAGVLIGLSVIVLSEPLLLAGANFKQYSFDVLITLVLLNLGRWAIHHGGGSARYVVIALVGATAVWFSFPSVFVIGGIGLTLIGSELLQGRRREAGAWIGSMTVCALSFGIAYFVSFRHYSGSTNLLTWWTSTFAPIPPRSIAHLQWYMDNFFALFSQQLAIREAGLAAVLMLFGIYRLWQEPERRVDVLLLLSPIFLVLIASGLHKYPFGGRTMLFSNPLLATLVAAGVAAILEIGLPRGRVLSAIIIAILLSYPVYVDAKYMIDPGARRYFDVKPTLSYIADHRKEGELLFVNWDADIVYNYYVQKRDFRNLKEWRPVISRAPGKVSRAEKAAFYERWTAAIEPNQRVWFLLGDAGQLGRGDRPRSAETPWRQA